MCYDFIRGRISHLKLIFACALQQCSATVNGEMKEKEKGKSRKREGKRGKHP